MEAELQNEASTSSSCLNLTEDETSSSTSVFLALDRLKYLQPSELPQKGKRKVNPPHGLHKSTTAQQSSSSREPKGINPANRVREYNNELFKVSNGKNFAKVQILKYDEGMPLKMYVVCRA